MSSQRVRNDHVDRLAPHRPGALQPSEGGVGDEVGVAVDQPRQHRAVVLRHLDAVRHVDSAGLDANDPVAIQQHSRTAGQEPGAIEGVRRTDRAHASNYPTADRVPPTPRQGRHDRTAIGVIRPGSTRACAFDGGAVMSSVQSSP